MNPIDPLPPYRANDVSSDHTLSTGGVGKKRLKGSDDVMTPAAASDTVMLSQLANDIDVVKTQLGAADAKRDAKLQEIRQRLASDTYHVDFPGLAKKIYQALS